MRKHEPTSLIRHLEVLRAVTEAVSRSLDLNEVVQRSLSALTHVTGHEIASLHLISLFHRDGFLARVTSFVVAEDLRHRGVGTALLGACERWAWKHRAERLEVTSGDGRDDAHRFYERQGYARQGMRFSKWLHKPARE